MQDDVERVARAMFAPLIKSQYPNVPDTQIAEAIDREWSELTAVARAAMAATLELAADGLREQVVPRGATYEARLGVEVAADWLQQRANDVKEAGNG